MHSSHVDSSLKAIEGTTMRQPSQRMRTVNDRKSKEENNREEKRTIIELGEDGD